MAKKEKEVIEVNPLFEEAKNKIIGIDRRRQGIGTLAEKTLHAVLKHYYAPDEEMHEIPIGNFVADIYTGKEIVEIQSRQFNVMRDKLAGFLKEYPVTIVHPIPRYKWLIWIDEENGELSKPHKSPKKGNVYQAFPEMYKIKMFLQNPNLHFKFVLMDMEEYRLLNGWSQDKKKGSHRYDRIPSQIVEEVCIDDVRDYMQFVPDTLEDEFTSAEFAKAAHINRTLAQTTLNILTHVGCVQRVGKQGNAFCYKVNEW